MLGKTIISFFLCLGPPCVVFQSLNFAVNLGSKFFSDDEEDRDLHMHACFPLFVICFVVILLQ